MDWMIWFTGATKADTDLYANFQAMCSDGRTLNFSVKYVFGATNAQKRSAILAAGIAAYELIFGQAPPATARAEIFGASSI